MDTITKKAYAKINLTLDVVSKLESGYHELNMIMQQISMHDVITVSKHDADSIILNCNKKISELKDNIVYKACVAMKEKYNIQSGIKVDLEKNIFLSAGLAGGSTDCATTILCINELFEINAPIEELMEIGGALGKDVVYCIHKGLAFATGDGTTLEKLNNYDETCVVVANPNFEVSTKAVFENFKFENQVKTNYKEMFKAIDENNVINIAKNFNNMLETVTIEKYPIIEQMKICLDNNNAIGSLMSGSGATVFGFYLNNKDATAAMNELKKEIPNVLVEVCHTL